MRFLRTNDDMDGTTLDSATCEQGVDVHSNEPSLSEPAPNGAPEELTPAILDVIDALIVVMDQSGRIVMFNQACERTTGYSFDEVAGKALWDCLLPTDEAAGVREVFESLRSGDYPNRHENLWLTKNAGPRLIAWSNTAIPNPDGTVMYVIGTGIDITERKAAEDGIRWRTEDLTLLNTLSESANRGDDLRTIARLLSLGTRKDLSDHGASLYLLDETGAELLLEGINLKKGVLEKIENLTGVPVEPTVRIRMSDCADCAEAIESGSAVVVDGEKGVEEFLREAIAASDVGMAPRAMALKLVPVIRKLLGVRALTFLPLISEGEPLGIISIGGKTPLTDIQMGRMTSIARQVAGIIRHRRAEEALLRSQESLAEAQRIAGIGNWSWDIASDKRFWSDEVYRMLGRTPDDCEANYDNFLAAVHPDDRERVRSALDMAIRTGRRYSIDHRLVRPDGTTLVVHERGELQFDDKGKPVYLIGLMQDVTKESRSKELQGVLLSIAEAVNRTESLEDLLGTIHSELGRLIDTTNFYVAVFDEDTGAYSFPYHIDEYDDATKLGPTFLGKSLTDYVRRNGQPILVDEQRYQELLAAGEIELIGAPSTAWLGVPLRSGGKDIGVVAVQSYRDVSPYTPYDLKLMSFVSDNIAMAVGRKLAEEQVNRRLAMEETISEVTSGLITHDAEETDLAVSEALAAAGVMLRARHCFMWLAEPGDAALDVHEWCAEATAPLLYELSAVVRATLPWLVATAKESGLVRADAPSCLPPEAGALRHFLESTKTESFLAVPMMDGVKLTGLVGVLGHQPGTRSAESVTFLRTLAAALASALERRRAEDALRSSFDSLRSTVEGTVDALSRLGEARDPYTAGHQQRVAEIACAIAGEMGFPADRIEGIRVASKLHDIGKIHVPGEILSKPGKLSDLEFGIIKTHPTVGYEILRTVEFPWPVAQVALQHHERLDGSGYPDGLSGEEILPEARIVAVADVVEAMCTHRPYRPALPIETAVEELRSNRGRFYGPTAVDACLKLLKSGKLALGE